MRMNGNYKILFPFEGRYSLHVSPNWTLNLSTKQSFDKACVHGENRTGNISSIFRKHFLPKLNFIKTITLLKSFKKLNSLQHISPSNPHVLGAFCMSLNACNFLQIMSEHDRGAQGSDISRSALQVWSVLDMTLHLLWNLFPCSFSFIKLCWHLLLRAAVKGPDGVQACGR